ncbi:DNase I-like protein [Marasmius fiardii PR-910]|nr:DNase I-like protein [Marasmius fiardii PR-910]
MRILTWNINGIRTIPQYHPLVHHQFLKTRQSSSLTLTTCRWNTLKTHNDILDYLQADIINFQEVKASRSILTKPVATPPSYDSFFSFPTSKSGYSGVATYTRSSAVVPLKAEEGLSFANRSSSLLKPGPELDVSERVSKEEAYPDSRVVLISSEDNVEEDRNDDVLALRNDLKSLDAEGRVLTLDFGMFVLINVYCPNDGSDERLPFKTDFHRVLEARVRGLIAEGREVVLLGDINACAALIDHCEGNLIIKRGIAEGYTNGEEWFWEEKHVRRWLRDLLVTETQDLHPRGRGCLVDIVRKFHPERKGMYTCWNTKISARDSNYGTRIDYILITPNLVPWIKAADIQPQIKGSDHCPVYIDLHDELIGKDGNTLKLKDVLSNAGDTKNEPPRLATRFWDEYSGKQKLLSSFFGGGKKGAATIVTTSTAQTSQAPQVMVAAPTATVVFTTPVIQDPKFDDTEKEQAAPTSPPSVSVSPATTGASSSKKRALSPEAASTSASGSAPTKKSKEQSRPSEVQAKTRPTSSTTTANKPMKLKPGQSKLSTFFAQPRSSASSSGNKQKTVKGKEKEKHAIIADISTTSTLNQLPPMDVDLGEVQDFDVDMQQPDSEEDYCLALALSSSQRSASSSSSQKQKETGEAWRSLMAPIQPPLCTVHREPAKEFTVNKPGANKGKMFFVCSRPVGPGYDKGRAERLREDVDPQYKCNFFKWSSEVRREMRKGQGG